MSEHAALYNTENPGMHYQKGNESAVPSHSRCAMQTLARQAIELTDYRPWHREVGGIDRR